MDSPRLIIISVSLQGWRLNHRFEENQILFWFLGRPNLIYSIIKADF